MWYEGNEGSHIRIQHLLATTNLRDFHPPIYYSPEVYSYGGGGGGKGGGGGGGGNGVSFSRKAIAAAAPTMKMMDISSDVDMKS